MTITAAAHFQSGFHSSQVDRSVTAGLLGASLGVAWSGGVGAADAGAHGVVGESALKVTQTVTPSLAVRVAVGQAFVRGTQDGARQGVYSLVSDAVETLALSAAHPTLARRDLIVARFRDTFYGDASNTGTIEVVPGTPGGADPVVPANSLVLGRVRVAAAASSVVDADIDDLRTRASAAGGVITCRSTTRPTNVSKGQVIFETDTGSVLVWYGATTGWKPPWNTAWGHVGSAAVTTDNGGITSLVDLAGLSVTFTAVAGRRYKITLDAYLNSSAGGDISSLVIANGGGTQLQSSQAYMPATGVSVRQVAMVTATPGAGSTTYKARASRAIGSGTLALAAGATYPAVIVVEDIGPSAAPA